MLHKCHHQTWCEKSCISINAEKTKIVIFNQHNFSPLHSTTRHHWHLQPSFPTSHRIPLEQVSNFKYLGTLLNNMLSMSPLRKQIIDSIQKSHIKLQATLAELKRNNNEQSVSIGHTNISPLVIRRLWYSCVLG